MHRGDLNRKGSRKCVNFFYRPSPPSLSPAPQTQRKPNHGAEAGDTPEHPLVRGTTVEADNIGALGQPQRFALHGERARLDAASLLGSAGVQRILQTN
jgi:hypothetical protein